LHFRHIGWHPIAYWIGRPVSLCLKNPDGTLAASMLISPDRLGIAWLHLFAVSDPHNLPAAWEALWKEANTILAGMHLSSVWVMTTHDWLIHLLFQSGFSEHSRVIALGRPAAREQPSGGESAALAPMTAADLTGVKRLDHRAFQPPWRMDSDALRATFDCSLLAFVHRSGDRPDGYLMAAAAPQGMHISRIAVHPGLQRRGIGRALLIRLLNESCLLGARRITVNTQIENQSSRRLYRAMGFSETGETYPVFRCRLPSV
jgi:[ribosomal protein S18]-alanine N-acetyltransferase